VEETQEVSLNTKTDGNVYPGKSNVKRTRQPIYDNQVITHVNDVTASENRRKNKLQPKGQKQMNQQNSEN